MLPVAIVATVRWRETGETETGLISFGEWDELDGGDGIHDDDEVMFYAGLGSAEKYAHSQCTYEDGDFPTIHNDFVIVDVWDDRW